MSGTRPHMERRWVIRAFELDAEGKRTSKLYPSMSIKRDARLDAASILARHPEYVSVQVCDGHDELEPDKPIERVKPEPVATKLVHTRDGSEVKTGDPLVSASDTEWTFVRVHTVQREADKGMLLVSRPGTDRKTTVSAASFPSVEFRTVDVAPVVSEAATLIERLTEDDNVTDAEARAVVEWLTDWARDVENGELFAVNETNLLHVAHRLIDGGLRFVLDDVRRVAIESHPSARAADIEPGTSLRNHLTRHPEEVANDERQGIHRACRACAQGLAWDGHTDHSPGCPDAPEPLDPAPTDSVVIDTHTHDRLRAIADEGAKLAQSLSHVAQLHSGTDDGFLWYVVDASGYKVSGTGWLNEADAYGELGHATRPIGLDDETAAMLGIDAATADVLTVAMLVREEGSSDITAVKVSPEPRTKWFLSYDPEVTTHPFTLVKVELPTMRPVEAIQLLASSDPLNALRQAHAGEVD